MRAPVINTTSVNKADTVFEDKIIVDKCFLLDFAQIVTKQLIDKQN